MTSKRIKLVKSHKSPTIKGGIFTNATVTGNASFSGPVWVTGTVKAGDYRNEGAAGSITIVNASKVSGGIFVSESGAKQGALTIGSASSSPCY